MVRKPKPEVNESRQVMDSVSISVSCVYQAPAGHYMATRSGRAGLRPGSSSEPVGRQHGAMTQAPEHSTPRPPARTDNGILARVPSRFIAKASGTLPDPACALDDEISVEIDADWAGRVRLTFRKQRYCRPRGKTAYVAWLCRHAEAVAPAGEA